MLASRLRPSQAQEDELEALRAIFGEDALEELAPREELCALGLDCAAYVLTVDRLQLPPAAGGALRLTVAPAAPGGDRPLPFRFLFGTRVLLARAPAPRSRAPAAANARAGQQQAG